MCPESGSNPESLSPSDRAIPLGAVDIAKSSDLSPLIPLFTEDSIASIDSLS